MAKTKKLKKQTAAKKRPIEEKKRDGISDSQTNQPLEQDVKRRIGHTAGRANHPS